MSIRVLHLSLSHGGGVISAMETYIQNSPFAEHFLIANVDESCAISFSKETKVSKIFNASLNFTGIINIYKAVHKIKPTHIHLHSSHAGALGRILFPFHKNIIYTPHCYSFERMDISVFYKTIFTCIEWLLSIKPTIVAGCSPREVELANGLGLDYFNLGQKNIFLTNYSSPQTNWCTSSKKSKTVVMVGRICPQKDAQFYIDTYKQVKLLDKNVNFLWLGGGNDEDVEQLSQNGISCSGWLAKDDLLKQLSQSDLYFHCAAWEGNPMSVLEAAAIKIPIVGRNIKSLESIGLTALGDTPESCAQLIYDYFNVDSGLAENQFKNVNELCSMSNQKQALYKLYHG